MAAVVNGVMTNIGRETLAKAFGFIGGFATSYAYYFKIGEGGFISTPGGNVPVAPDPSREDLAAEDDPALFAYRKDLTVSDISFISPSIIQLRCQLLPTEANDNGSGENPKFFEIGIFDLNDKMIGYATFDEQTKNVTKTLILYVQIQF